LAFLASVLERVREGERKAQRERENRKVTRRERRRFVFSANFFFITSSS
jgi:hypothetical protein